MKSMMDIIFFYFWNKITDNKKNLGDTQTDRSTCKCEPNDVCYTRMYYPTQPLLCTREEKKHKLIVYITDI